MGGPNGCAKAMQETWEAPSEKERAGANAERLARVPASLWKTYNPDPNVIKQSQWGYWRPAAPGQPLQMVSEGTPWFQMLGAMLSEFSKVRPQHQKTSAMPILCKNGFEVLQDDSTELDEPNTATATAQSSSGGVETEPKVPVPEGSRKSRTKVRFAEADAGCGRCFDQGCSRAPSAMANQTAFREVHPRSLSPADVDRKGGPKVAGQC